MSRRCHPMPKYLRIACILFIFTFCGMAVLAPLHESGIYRVTSPLLLVSFAVVAILFMRRAQWTWQWMKWMGIVTLVINGSFFPEPRFYGPYTVPARIFISIQLLACCVILWSIVRHQNTWAWFTNRRAGAQRSTEIS
ncbi:hypothetical protein [Variovorax sp. E3]|uniref:hypothetical protein n=1 Tax=Variovorax sp. E3 TaxID=1914993 RepID=UPI0022B6D010|nr:hypothetical protein [Variovorax sp. E3]